jgi:hypothetical protein
MVVIPVPSEAYCEIDRIALNYRQIAIKPDSTIIAKAFNKAIKDRQIIVENVDIGCGWPDKI